MLNSKVFFWLSRERLIQLLNAGTYCTREHDVLELDANAVVNAYAQQIVLCPINSGCTKPFPHPRGSSTFLEIPQYPYAHWKRKRKRGERAVELAINYSVPDVANYVKRVVRMKGPDELVILWRS